MPQVLWLLCTTCFLMKTSFASGLLADPLAPGHEEKEKAHSKALIEKLTELQDLRFPQLNQIQKSFATNPGYRSFFDRRIRTLEKGLIQSGEQDQETAPAEYRLAFSGTKPTNNKKASLFSLDRDVSGVASRLNMSDNKVISDLYFTTVVAVSSALAVFAIVGAGFCYHRVRRNSKASEDVEYHPSYGVTGPGKEVSPTAGTDRKLAQSAQMYHYQHQKQQMIAFDSTNGSSNKRSSGGGSAASDCDSDDDDGEEGDYTVYECPGLAPAGEMEVHNPLFQDDTTPKASK